MQVAPAQHLQIYNNTTMIYLYLSSDDQSRLTVQYFGKRKADAIEYFNEQLHQHILNVQGNILSIGRDETKTQHDVTVFHKDGSQRSFLMYGILDQSRPLVYYPHNGYFRQKDLEDLPYNPVRHSHVVNEGRDLRGPYYIIFIDALAEQSRLQHTKSLHDINI